MINIDEQRLAQQIDSCDPFRAAGRLESVQGAITVSLPASIGELVEIRTKTGQVID